MRWVMIDFLKHDYDDDYFLAHQVNVAVMLDWVPVGWAVEAAMKVVMHYFSHVIDRDDFVHLTVVAVVGLLLMLQRLRRQTLQHSSCRVTQEEEG